MSLFASIIALIELICVTNGEIPPYMFRNNIYIDPINGIDDSYCLTSNSSGVACETLDYAFKFSLYPKNTMATFILEEDTIYKLKKTVAPFKDLKFLTILGGKGSVIECDGEEIGLAFIDVMTIDITNVTFLHCAATRESTSRNVSVDSLVFSKFKVGLYFESCDNVSMRQVNVSFSPNATGVVMYDTTGTNTILDSVFMNNSVSHHHYGGGGVYVEFSYHNQGSRNQIDGAYYSIRNSIFLNNIAKRNGIEKNASIYHEAFGRGGGLSVFMKGAAMNNLFNISGCHFTNNMAQWGGGLFIDFHDSAANNSAYVTNCTLSHNKCPGTGTGGGMRIGYMSSFDLASNNHTGNYIEIAHSEFLSNTAMYGGGLLVSTALDQSLKEAAYKEIFLKITNVTFQDNLGKLGGVIDMVASEPINTTDSRFTSSGSIIFKRTSTFTDDSSIGCTNIHTRSLALYFVLKGFSYTIVFLILALFDIRLTSGPAHAFILYSHVVTSALDFEDGSQDLIMNSYKFFYGLFNFDFIEKIFPTVCLNWTTSFLLLNDGIALFPLIWISILNNYFLIFFPAVQNTESLVPTSLLLSYSKFSLASSYIIGVNLGLDKRSLYLQHEEPTIPEGWPILILVLAFILLVLFIPTLLLVYAYFIDDDQGKVAHIDNFLEFYKKHFRFFAGFFFLFHLTINVSTVLSGSWLQSFAIQQIATILMATLIAYCQPYKRENNVLNLVTTCILADLAIVNVFIYATSQSSQPPLFASIILYVLLFLPLLMIMYLAVHYEYLKFLQVIIATVYRLRERIMDTGTPEIIFLQEPIQVEISLEKVTIKGPGIFLTIPENSLNPTEERATVSVHPCISGPFKLPDGYEAASPVYLIKLGREVKLQNDIKVRINNYACLESEEDREDMVFLSAPVLRVSKYFFKEIEVVNGVFKPECRNFCLCLGKRKREPPFPGSGIKKKYSARMYQNISQNLVKFCICLYHEVYIKHCDEVVMKEGWQLSHECTVQLTSEEVSLCVDGGHKGWDITIGEPAMISRQDVDLSNQSQEDVPYPPSLSISYSVTHPQPSIKLKVTGLNRELSYNMPSTVAFKGIPTDSQSPLLKPYLSSASMDIDLKRVMVIQTVTIDVFNGFSKHFFWEDYGLRLTIPVNALPKDISTCKITIKASLCGKYAFPEKMVLVSPVFWLKCVPSCKFQKPLILEIQHCAPPENTSRLSMARALCSQKHLPYSFKVIPGGIFNEYTSYGVIPLDRFSGLAVVQEGSDKRRYWSSVFYMGPHIRRKIHFAVTWHDDAHVITVRKQYSSKNAQPGTDQPLYFEGDEIKLDLPTTGCTLHDEWRLYPTKFPKVRKRDVDDTENVKETVPHCEIEARWLKKVSIVNPLEYNVNILGTTEKDQYFTITVADDTSVSIPGPIRDHQDENSPISRRGVKIALQGITKEWNDLAEALGLSESDIDTIKTNNPGDVRQCVKEVVDQWFKRKGSESPSWTNLCKALRDVLVHRNDVALEIEKHH